MMAEKKRKFRPECEAMEKRLPPPGEVPSFYEGCIGSPFLWNELVNYHKYGEKSPGAS